jgi:gliding motility-associated-like protein
LKNKFLIVSVLFLITTLRLSAQSNLQFIENKGQWDKTVKYKADISNGAFFLHKDGFTVLLQNTDDLKKLHDQSHNLKKNIPTTAANVSDKITDAKNIPAANNDLVIHSHAYRVHFLEVNDNVEMIADKPLENYNNYYLGNDSSKWAPHCRIFQGITYKNIYPNIDARYYTDKGVLKYDLIVHPGGNPDRIIMKYEGADKINIRKNQLLVKTSVGTNVESIPSSYQLNKTGRREVECNYFMAADNTVRFKLKNYSPDATLVIDPTLIFSSYSGCETTNWGFTATYGPDGSFFAGGIVHDAGYPVSTGAFQTKNNGGTWDIGLMKFNTVGTKQLYATYLGGSGTEYPHSLVVDAQGNLIVFGRTGSGASFPAPTLVGSGGGRDIFVTKFNSTGTSLIGSIRIGGAGDDGVNIEDQDETNPNNLATESLIQNYGDWSRGEVILDGGGNIYVASCTQSSKTDGTGFPIIGNVFQPQFGGGAATQSGKGQDGVIIKINPNCNAVIFSSFLGGSNDDAALVLDLSPATGDIYVGGATYSKDIKGTSGNVIQPTPAGNIDGFVSVISQDGQTLKYTTYLGTTGNDMIYGVKFDKFGFPYVMGTTTGTWPVKLLNPATDFINPGAKQFIAKLQPDLSAVVYSTTFGTPNSKTPNISPVAFLVDRCQNVYVSGWGSFYALVVPDPYGLAGTTGMQVTPDAIKPTTDNRDFYFIVIKRDAASLLYGTFFGQGDDANTISEHVDGGTSRYDKNGVIYQAICANCGGGGNPPFKTTVGAIHPTNGALNVGGCNVAAVKIAFNFAGVAAGLKSIINGLYDSSGCVPLGVTFVDTVRNAKSYIWTFGDGTPDTATTAADYQVTHTYTNIGDYLVRLIAIDSTTCNIRDTAYIHIRARNDKAILGYTFAKLPPCQSLSYQFNNISTAPPGKPFTDSSFIWDFGDGTIVSAGSASVNHSYAAPGSYTVRLLLVDTNYCNYPDSVVQTLSIAALVKAQFITPAAGCAPYNAVFTNTSAGGQQFIWDFGDGGTANIPSPTHLYPNVGTYTVTLTVIDSNTCNIIDDTSVTITVSPKPHAAFTTSPDPPVFNTPTVFNNGSTGAVSYKWLFGDGDSTTSNSLDTVMHQYQKTGTFNACLIAYNEFQCTDTTCNPVQAIIQPLLDVPNAFTPGRFGVNSIVKVRGFGISKIIFRIYNRWGQKVFESNNIDLGWDGTFNGTPQPMDVYAYTVEAEYFDGTRATKKGDITLLR